MKGIEACVECGYYIHPTDRCTHGANKDNPKAPFFADCPLKDVQPVVVAHWEVADIPLPYQIRTPDGTTEHRTAYICSACGEYNDQNTRFCPHCGANIQEE